MFSSWKKISGVLLVISFVTITVALKDSPDTNVPSIPLAYGLNARFKRQFDGGDGSLGQSVNNLQQQQQQQQQQSQNSRPWQQGQNGNSGLNSNFGAGQQQFGQQPIGTDQLQSGSAQIPSWNNPNTGNQGSWNSNQNAQNVIRPQTTQRAPANIISSQTTTNEAQCIRDCPATNQWNPVCGNDNISYGNMNKLRCAQQCGRQVSFVYNGSCVTTPAPNK